MYPTSDSLMFGSFVKSIESTLVQNGMSVDKIVIEGLSKSILEKIKKYLIFYWKILVASFSSYDIIYIHYPSHSFITVLLRKIKKSKIVIHIHGHDLVPPNKITRGFLLGRWITLLASRKSSLTIVPSKFFQKELLKYNPSADTFVYPSGGVNCEEFFPSQFDKQKSFVIGYVGRVDNGKGVDVLLRSLTMCDFDYKAIIVGGGSIGHGSQIDEIKKLAETLHIDNKIEFIGSVEKSRLPYYYNQFSISIFPTLFQESFGMVGIEAMSCGVPVIGSNIGALPEYIIPDVNGYLFEPGNHQDLAFYLNKFYNLSDDKKSEFRNNALRSAKQYDSKEITNALILKFESLGNKIA
jgi:glycosyltransferase involved in cell wall biosynthesis